MAHFKDASSLPELTALMHQDPRPVIRGTAAWAIGKIGDPDYAEELEKALQKEQDEDAIREIEKGLELLSVSEKTKTGRS